MANLAENMTAIEPAGIMETTTDADEAPKSARTTSSWRKRQAKKANRADKQRGITSDRIYLFRDRARAKAERRLLAHTRGLPQQCLIKRDRMRLFEKLFEAKETLPETDAERRNDDIARRNAVEEIMQAREAKGWEVEGEAARWQIGNGGQNDLDIEAELNKKFTSEYLSMTTYPSHRAITNTD